MKLSILIVSYNVRFFLEQCLSSVLTAITDVQGDAEVIVVDNHSQDQTVEYLKTQFPAVEFISSQENLGFGKANNLALSKASGEFILFLNPDTILPENGLSQIIRFMENHPTAGAAGIRMIDGSGTYLPESKRGFPGPWTSFCKMFGLTKAVPGSRIFAHYYMGYLNPLKNQQVEILAGAYMLVKKAVLDKVGAFDEQFFMYAEDIDLSYRILQKGYNNFYFAETPIIHFKGESTRKDARYVKLFYEAMILFVRKHFTGSASFFYRKFLEAGIRFRSAFSMASMAATRSEAVSPRFAYLTGDAVSISEVKALLEKQQNIRLADQPNEATIMIYCIGKSYPASAAINEMQQHKKQKMFHFAGTNSIVGSHTSDRNGEVIA